MKKFFLFVLLISFKMSVAQLCLSPLTNYSVDSVSQSMISADFNTDGIADIAVTNYHYGTVSVLLGTGAGIFGAATVFSSGPYPISITNADFNGDGFMDLAVANYTANNLSVLLGTGTGSFNAPTNYYVGTNPNVIVQADFNGDYKVDLAVCRPGSTCVTTLLGNGNGTFGSATDIPVGSVYPYGVCCADFNGDGFVDFATANYSDDNISILLGYGNGTFTAPTNFTALNNPYGIISADLNEDGKLDLATANWGLSSANNVSVLLGTGNGTFGNATYFPVGSDPWLICASDLDGDGHLDLTTSNNHANDIAVILGNGFGNFGSSTHFSVGTYPVALVSADFNGDSKPDLATGNWRSHDVSVLLNCFTMGLEQLDEKHVVIFPNPGNSNLTIETNSTEDQKMAIFDVNGKMVLQQVINQKTNIDISNLSEGVYNVTIINSENPINKRLVILK